MKEEPFKESCFSSGRVRVFLDGVSDDKLDPDEQSGRKEGAGMSFFRGLGKTAVMIFLGFIIFVGIPFVYLDNRDERRDSRVNIETLCLKGRSYVLLHDCRGGRAVGLLLAKEGSMTLPAKCDEDGPAELAEAVILLNRALEGAPLDEPETKVAK